MAHSHTVIPIDEDILWLDEAIQYFEDDMTFVPNHLPRGRFPTLSELREVIQSFGYQLEESMDWYVSTHNDWVEIWFRGKERHEDKPISIWFRRGGDIVLNLTQGIANHCGSIVTSTSYNDLAVLFIPDSLFPPPPKHEQPLDYISTIAYRIPIMLDRIKTASLDDTLLYLSQIRQAVRSIDYKYHEDLYQAARKSMSVYISLLQHSDGRVRFLAYCLVVIFGWLYDDNLKAVIHTFRNEPDIDIKTQMIDALEKRITPISKGDSVDEYIGAILDALMKILEDPQEAAPVRFAANRMMACGNPGQFTSTMRSILVNALIQPDLYETKRQSQGSVIGYALESIDTFSLQQRINIFIEALPKMNVAEDAYEVLVTLLNNVFWGRNEVVNSSSLQDLHVAERPEIDPSKFRRDSIYHRYYERVPPKIDRSELTATQREILNTVMDIELPFLFPLHLL